jgi:hypothetical protein
VFLGPDHSGQASILGTSTPSISRLVSAHRTDSPPTSAGDTGAVREGLGSLNRWSQSTASNKSPPRYTGYHRGSSRLFDYDNPNPPKSHVSPTGNIPLQHSRHVSASDPAKLYSNTRPESGVQPTINLPSAIPSRSVQVSAKSTSTSASLFHDPWEKDQGPSQDSSEVDTPSHRISPISQTYSKEMATNSPSTEEKLSPFADTETYKGKHQRGQSQKTMLSKALQKANTAVLLDNAANFEGAMDAYNDACYLLQLVMLRSNGGEDEKLKLQEIVRLPLIIT